MENIIPRGICPRGISHYRQASLFYFRKKRMSGFS